MPPRGVTAGPSGVWLTHAGKSLLCRRPKVWRGRFLNIAMPAKNVVHTVVPCIRQRTRACRQHPPQLNYMRTHARSMHAYICMCMHAHNAHVCARVCVEHAHQQHGEGEQVHKCGALAGQHGGGRCGGGHCCAHAQRTCLRGMQRVSSAEAASTWQVRDRDAHAAHSTGSCVPGAGRPYPGRVDDRRLQHRATRAADIFVAASCSCSSGRH